MLSLPLALLYSVVLPKLAGLAASAAWSHWTTSRGASGARQPSVSPPRWRHLVEQTLVAARQRPLTEIEQQMLAAHAVPLRERHSFEGH